VNTILSEFEDGRGTEKDLAILHDHVDYLGPGRTFCALAPGAAAPLGSGLKHFKEDFERHIKDQRCSYKGV
jgi:NADH-quinone oxidoreductase subunit F